LYAIALTVLITGWRFQRLWLRAYSPHSPSISKHPEPPVRSSEWSGTAEDQPLSYASNSSRVIPNCDTRRWRIPAFFAALLIWYLASCVTLLTPHSYASTLNCTSDITSPKIHISILPVPHPLHVLAFDAVGLWQCRSWAAYSFHLSYAKIFRKRDYPQEFSSQTLWHPTYLHPPYFSRLALWSSTQVGNSLPTVRIVRNLTSSPCQE